MLRLPDDFAIAADAVAAAEAIQLIRSLRALRRCWASQVDRVELL
jgi:hypothetical protein